MLARSGVNPRTAMELMRHSDIRLTTNIYQHLELVDTAGAVNVGSVLTVDAISHTGAFCGGAIAPGPRMMLAALHQQVETLPEVVMSDPPPGFGRNTADAIRSGVYWGTVAVAEKLINKVGGEAIGGNRLFFTGQDGEWLGKALGMRHEYIPVLALEGLALAAGKGRS